MLNYDSHDKLLSRAMAAGYPLDDDSNEPVYLDQHGFIAEPLWIDTTTEKRLGHEKTIILDTIPNTEVLLSALGVTVRYNMMTRLEEYTGGIVEGKTINSAVHYQALGYRCYAGGDAG